MEFIFKTETQILTKIDTSQMTRDILKEIQNTFMDKPIKKYEITFKEGVVVKQIDRLENIKPEMVSAITVTVG